MPNLTLAINQQQKTISQEILSYQVKYLTFDHQLFTLIFILSTQNGIR